MTCFRGFILVYKLETRFLLNADAKIFIPALDIKDRRRNVITSSEIENISPNIESDSLS